MASIVASRLRHAVGSPLYFAVETDRKIRPGELGDLRLLLGSLKAPREILVLHPRVTILGDESFRLIAVLSSAETGLYSVSLNLRPSIRAEMPLLLMQEADLQQLVAEEVQEPFLEREDPPEFVEARVRSAFRERMVQIGEYDPTIYQVASQLEEMRFGSAVVGRLPGAEISWIVEMLADEFLYVGPLGFREVSCSMSAQAGRFSMTLQMLLQIPSHELASYFNSGNAELALAQATQKLSDFETEVEASGDRVSISVAYRFRRFLRGNSEGGRQKNLGGSSVSPVREVEPAGVPVTAAC